MRNDRRVDAELGECLAATRAVNHHAVESVQQAAPEVALRSGAARQEVVRREHGRRAQSHADVELGKREPLQVQHVGLDPSE